MKKVISVVFLTASLCVLALAQDGKPPAGEAGESQVVLRVNGQEVTRVEFEKLLVQQKAREFMEEVIEGLLIEQAAKEAEVAVTDKEIEERQQEVFLQEMSYYDNDMAKLEEELKRYGYSIEERKKRNAHKTRLLLFVEKMIKKESVSEESLKRLFKERYSKNADRVAKVYHMLVSTEEKRRHIQQEITNLKLKSRVASAEQKLKIETQIAGLTEKLEKWKKFTSRSAVDEAVKRLREGADFGQIAEEYGAGYTATAYDMGWVTRDNVFNLLARAIFDQLKPGEISEPIQSRYGFHVVKLIDIEQPSELKYEQVKPYLLREVRDRRVENTQIRDFVIELREKASIERPGLTGAPSSGSGK